MIICSDFFLQDPETALPAEHWYAAGFQYSEIPPQYPFPTTIDFGTGKTDTYVNNVAPTAQIYLHLICRTSLAVSALRIMRYGLKR